jgi:hypothetical protein
MQQLDEVQNFQLKVKTQNPQIGVGNAKNPLFFDFI